MLVSCTALISLCLGSAIGAYFLPYLMHKMHCYGLPDVIPKNSIPSKSLVEFIMIASMRYLMILYHAPTYWLGVHGMNLYIRFLGSAKAKGH